MHPTCWRTYLKSYVRSQLADDVPAALPIDWLVLLLHHLPRRQDSHPTRQPTRQLSRWPNLPTCYEQKKKEQHLTAVNNDELDFDLFGGVSMLQCRQTNFKMAQV